MKQLTPLPLRENYYKDIENEINRIFYEILFKPLVFALEVRRKEVINTKDPLYDAVASGRIWHEDGKFKGRFSAKTSAALKSIGAKYNIKSKTWTYIGVLPAQISQAIVKKEAAYAAQKSRVIAALDSINTDDINKVSNIPTLYQETLESMDGDFKKTVKSIKIVPKLTEDQIVFIGSEWGQNLDLHIKGWTDDNIVSLREKVEENVFSGRRSSSMVKGIQQNYGVSKAKATFLARQETGLMMAKFRETRYKSIGSTKYKWSGANDERERQDHKDLNGTIHSWDSPPITNKKTGARNHPTEDYGCRCVAIAIIE